MKARSKDSARFEPYFKLERYDQRIFAWKPVGRSFATFGSAREYACDEFRGPATVRVLRVSEDKGYEVVATLCIKEC